MRRRSHFKTVANRGMKIFRMATKTESETALEQRVANEALYDHLWARLPLYPHHAWPIWDSLSPELGGRCLELGAGVLPRIPVSGGFFVDLSQSALRKLVSHGGHSVRASSRLPFCDGAFRAICAFEVLEHIPDDDEAMSEISRVLAPGGALLMSVPVNPELYTGFDAACEHVRRYDAVELCARLAEKGMHIERWSTQRNNFSKFSGWLAGVLLRLSLRMPRLLLWLKRSAVKNQLARRLNWRTDDVADSHREGGFIAIFRRRD